MKHVIAVTSDAGTVGAEPRENGPKVPHRMCGVAEDRDVRERPGIHGIGPPIKGVGAGAASGTGDFC